MKTNKNNHAFRELLRPPGLGFGAFLLAFSTIVHAQDLLSGTDLQDSPLSISLSTSVQHQTNTLVLGQYGIFNNATISQSANGGNHVALLQQGDSNVANILQQGTDNTVNAQQWGQGNQLDVIQQGNANTANIWQSGEQQFRVHQIGSNMVVNVYQR
ncbi:curlin subunit CsgB [Bowmanella yangjiangensis]|uniref:Curlin subunit CsgB n=1 Tax=Bowmanella yangjiangensis TaxID=2811230 RepID=A0ABS3CPL9_9ALTE|nr:curlin subunit CsgB [Bowmanella yangjiangensis]MBN7818640.1 curlin subunit CsgB [Bowmanella yangjiangensis]